MIIRAPKIQNNFYVLDKSISEDESLTWAARGLLIFLLGKPDNWEVSVAHLIKQTEAAIYPSKRDAVYSLLKELMAVGYVSRIKEDGAGGTFGKTNYLVSESPRNQDSPITADPEVDAMPVKSPLTAQPYTDEPYTVNPTLIRTKYKQELKETRTENNIIEKFKIPTLEEIENHINEKGYAVDPELFIAHYTSNGWLVGKNKMKCWRSALVTWNKNSAQKSPNSANNRNSGFAKPTQPQPQHVYHGNMGAIDSTAEILHDTRRL